MDPATITRSKPSSDELALITSARRGNRAAFRTLVERHQRKAYHVALGILRDPDDARDACQDAFLKVYRSLERFEGDSQFYTWLYRIVVNLCIDYLRRRRFECGVLDERRLAAEDSSDGVTPRHVPDPARSLADKELRGRLQKAFAQLSPTHRSVITLREMNGLSYKEIAQVMSCSIGTVMSRLFHARKRMQALLVDDSESFALAA